jgi:hypothetical protein
MAGLIFFWTATCTHFSDVQNEAYDVTYSEIRPVLGSLFADKVGSTAFYVRKKQEPVCKHE